MKANTRILEPTITFDSSSIEDVITVRHENISIEIDPEIFQHAAS